jgi:tetratricopeptide (TPR) repeat protein
MRWFVVLILLVCPRFAGAQTSSQPEPQPVPQSASQPSTQQPQLSPQVAYDEAMRPLDITRRLIENWSDAERAALAVGVQQASKSCESRSPGQFRGEDLIAYLRLCYLGEQWDLVRQAAMNYRREQSAATAEEKKSGFPSLATAFDYEVQASLRLGDLVDAIDTSETMLRTVAYDDLTSDATSAAIRAVQLQRTSQAMAVLNQRQPILLSLMRGYALPDPATATSAHPPLSLNALYADAIALPTLLQFANQPKDAAASFAELEAELPSRFSPDDAILIGESRRQYQLLGSPLPAIATYVDLLKSYSVSARDLDRKSDSATVLLLFPEWCAQCVGMGKQFAPTAARLNQKGARFYALLAQDHRLPPTLKPAPRPAVARGPKSASANAAKSQLDQEQIHVPTAAELLAGTPTLVVPSQTLDTFVARDFPLIVVADRNGIVRIIQVAPEKALVPDGFIDQIVDRVLEQWPLPTKSK